MFHGRSIITHLKDTFSDSFSIKVSSINTIMVLVHYNFFIVKLKLKNKDTIKGSLIEDIPQDHVTSSSMFKCILLRRIHINRESIPLEGLMQLLVP